MAHIPKKTILGWLENYEYLAVGDRPPEAVPTNSGPKSADGIRNGFLNKVMLDNAVDHLPTKYKAIIKSKYYHQHPRKKTLLLLGISKTTYYAWIEQAVSLIYENLNGK